MRNKGFTIIEMMVSLVVLLVVIAITVAVITYQSRLGVYKIQATSAQQAVETALVLIRNDLMQAGRWAMQSGNRLFIKYNGFINLEAPSTPADNCTNLRSASCPSCGSTDCGADWTIVVNKTSFTVDRFPNFYWAGTGQPSVSDFSVAALNNVFGALNLSKDCKTLLGGATLLSCAQVNTNPTGMQTLMFNISGSFDIGSSASPAIVYQCINNELLRNDKRILGGDVSVQSLTFKQYPLYWSVIVNYQWKSSLPTSESVAIPSTQEIRVGIPGKYILRVGG